MLRQVLFEILVLTAVLPLKLVDLEFDQLGPRLFIFVLEQFEDWIDDAQIQAPQASREKRKDDGQDQAATIRPGAAKAAQEVLHPVASRPWEWIRAPAP